LRPGNPSVSCEKFDAVEANFLPPSVARLGIFRDRAAAAGWRRQSYVE